ARQRPASLAQRDEQRLLHPRMVPRVRGWLDDREAGETAAARATARRSAAVSVGSGAALLEDVRDHRRNGGSQVVGKNGYPLMAAKIDTTAPRLRGGVGER